VVAVVNLERQLNVGPGVQRHVVSQFPGKLGVGHQSAQTVKRGLELAVSPLHNLCRHSAFDHLAQQVPLVIDGHQGPTIDLGLNLGDPSLDVGLLIKLVADLPGVVGMRSQLGVSGLTVQSFGDEPAESLVQSVGQARHDQRFGAAAAERGGRPTVLEFVVIVVLLGWIMPVYIIEVKRMVSGVVAWIVKIYEKTVKPLDLA